MATSSIHAEIEDFGLRARFAAAGMAARERAGPLVRAVALAGVRRIKLAMPVDTGRARASWGIWTPADLQESNKDASQEDAVFIQSGDGLTVTQGTNVPYVESLNEGHSQQAPAEFINAASDAMAEELAHQIDMMLDGLI